MDVSIPLIFFVIFVVGFLSLFVVYKFSIKEKSYEEALAEQRQQTNALLGVKPKPKEKKSKKAAKKSKEKTTVQEDTESVESEKDHHSESSSHSGKPHVEFKEQPEEVPIAEEIIPIKEVVKSKEKTTVQEDTESVESEKDHHSESSSHSGKPHVEFKEQPEEVPIAEEIIPIKEVVKSKKGKKVRPILVKKDQPKLNNVKLDVVETPIINHFEENPPKDEFELLRSNSKDDLQKHHSEALKEKPVKEKKQDPPTAKTNKKASKQTAAPTQVQVAAVTEPLTVTPPAEEKPIEEKIVEAVPTTLQSNGIIGNTGKEKKKIKSKFNVRQQLTAERDGLINSVRTADLSKTDVQILINLLLNKQLEAPDKLDEWTEGKSDPVQKLKKQLAEKEKLLVEEQEALAGAQARVREVRAEQQTEKAQFQQKIRGLEEALQLKQVELNTTAAHHQAGAQKIQHLQAELNNEIARSRKMAEEISVLQMQAQQNEISLSQVQEMLKVSSRSICIGLLRTLLFIAAFCLAILFLPNLPPYDAEYKDTFSVGRLKPLEGKLALNERLSKLELLHQGELPGPEAFADLDGAIYTGLINGDIVKLTGEHITTITKMGRPCRGMVEESICGRPLGLKFDKNGVLFVADAYHGIIKVNVETGSKEVLISPDTIIDGKQPKLFDALDLIGNGDIVWSDSSTIFRLEDGVFIGLSDPNGRLVYYNATTKQNKVLIDKLHFSNGVILSEDESEVLVAETFRNRIHRYYLKGPKAGTHDIFIDGLPGCPDNINHDGKGGYLVPLVAGVDQDHPQIFNVLAPYPLVRKFVSRIMALVEMIFEMIHRAYPNDFSEHAVYNIGNYATLGPLFSKYRVSILHVSKSGEILDSIHTLAKPLAVCEAYILNDTLYLGSPFDNHIGRIKLKDVGWGHLVQDRQKKK